MSDKKRKTDRIMSNPKLLGIGFLCFGLTVVASVTSTYAWWSVSEIGKVTLMQFAIDASSSCKIGMRKTATDEIKYFDSINDGLLEEYNEGYYPGKPLKDLSSMYQSLWLNDSTDHESALPVLRSSYGDENSNESTVALDGFYQFELFLKSDADMYLFLDSEKTYFKSLHEENERYVNEINKNITKDSNKLNVKDLDKVMNACRVSFFSKDGFYIYEPNVYESTKTAFGGTLDIKEGDHYYDYIGDHEIVYGEYREPSKIVYDDPLPNDKLASGKLSTFNANHKAGIRAFNKEKSEANGFRFQEEKTYSLQELGLNENKGHYDPTSMTSLAFLKKGLDHRLVVTIYVEGWDLDANDSISGAKFSANLAFRGLTLS